MDELRALPKPPEGVKLALEPVVAMISGVPKKAEWAEVKEWLRKPNFIQQVLTFDKESITP